tara:strand:- start:509 stop:679 length:171 start_codon:yes stop_codon:yes gene_type:complete
MIYLLHIVKAYVWVEHFGITGMLTTGSLQYAADILRVIRGAYILDAVGYHLGLRFT